MRRTVILFASLSIILLGLWGSAEIFLDEDRLKGMVSEQMAQQTGRKVEIRGALRVRLFPRLHILAEQVVISGPEGIEGPQLLEADSLSMSVRVLPLIRGNFTAGRVGVSGATLNLYTDSEGRGSLDGLAAAARSRQAESDAAVLSTRQLRLEDLRLRITDLSTERVETVQVDLVELDRFSFDRPLQFSFKGNLGDPPLFEQLSVQGLLSVPSHAQEPIRLSEMRVSGRLQSTRQPLSLNGQLAMSAAPPLRFLLERARLEIGGQSMMVEAAYDGGQRGKLELSVTGDVIHLPTLAGAVAMDTSRMLPYVRGMDTEVGFDLGRVALQRASLEGVSARLVSTSGIVEIRAFEALMPGAMIEAGGAIDARYHPPRSEVLARVEMDDIEEWLSEMKLPGVLRGSGRTEFDIQAIGLPGEWHSVEGLGEFELWDGAWTVFDQLADEPSQQLEFHRLAGQYRLTPGFIDLPELQLSTERFEARGWAAIDLNENAVGGRLLVDDDEREVELSGSLESMRMTLPEPAVGSAGQIPGTDSVSAKDHAR